MQYTYNVINGGECKGRFHIFADAWVFVKLKCKTYAIISHAREGYWIVNPPLTN